MDKLQWSRAAQRVAGLLLLVTSLAALPTAVQPKEASSSTTGKESASSWRIKGQKGAEGMGMIREAYVTLAATPEYVIGAEVLAKCLRRTGTYRRMVVMISNRITGVMEQQLEKAGWEMLRFQEQAIAPHDVLDPPDRPYLNTTYNKLHVFALGDSFDKVVFLDADTLVLHNIDDLFSRDLSTGYPFAASPDIMPPDHFNTGVMVVRPDADVYARLLRAAAGLSESLDESEAGFLNSFFPEWYRQSDHHRIPFEYNVLQTITHFYEPAWNLLRSRTKVLHFAGDSASKPWSYNGSLPPSLGVYLYLWQSIARTGTNDNITPLFDVLKITDTAQVNALFQQQAN